MLDLFLATEQDTIDFGQSLAKVCQAPCIIFLEGDLGTGKTTLVRSFIQALGYQGTIKSPTYTLVEPYTIQQQLLFHFDLYRLQDPQELEFIGIEDYFMQKGIFLIEWPERGTGVLPPADLTCYIQHRSLGRQLQVSAKTEYGEKILANLKKLSISTDAHHKIKK